MNNIKKLTPLDKLAYGSGDMAINISIISASLLVYAFYVKVVGLTPVDAGWLLLVVRVIDAVSDPLMGWMTGRVRTRWGRFRPWIFVGAIPLGVSLYLMFINPGDTYSTKLVWAYSTYIANTLLFTTITIPYISLVGAITNDPAERLSANTYRFTMAKAATLFVTALVPYWVVDHFDPNEAYATSFMMLGTLSAFCLLLCGAFVKEQVIVEEKAPPFLDQAKSMLKNDQWMILSGTIIILLIGFIVRGNLALFYGTEFAGGSKGWSIALFMGMWSLGGFLAAIISEQLTKSYCKIKVFSNSLFVAAVVGVIAYLVVDKGEFYLAVLFYLLSCLISEINTPILWASVTEVGDYGKNKTGTDASALTMGSISFCQKFGMGIAGPITGYMLTFIGYESGSEVSESTWRGLSFCMAFVPAIFFALAGLIMRKYIISNDYYNKMVSNEPSIKSRKIGDLEGAM